MKASNLNHKARGLNVTVKSWQPVFKMLKTHLGNSIIDPRNKTAISTYNVIEGDTRLSSKYSGLKSLYIRDRGERL